MGQRVFEEWAQWGREATDLETMLDEGEQAMADLIQALSARGLPAGAVIEIEFSVRRREAAFA